MIHASHPALRPPSLPASSGCRPFWCTASSALTCRTASTAYSLSAAWIAITATTSSSCSSRLAHGEPRPNCTDRTTSHGRSYEPTTLRIRIPLVSASTRGRVNERIAAAPSRPKPTIASWSASPNTTRPSLPRSPAATALKITTTAIAAIQQTIAALRGRARTVSTTAPSLRRRPRGLRPADVAVAGEPGGEPVGSGSPAQCGEFVAEDRTDPAAEVLRLVGRVGMLGDDPVHDPVPAQVDRPYALGLRHLGGPVGRTVHDRACPLGRQRREPAVLRGDHPVRGQQRERTPAAALAQQQTQGRCVQRHQLGEAPCDLPRHAALLGFHRQRRTRCVDHRHQRQPELGGEPHAAPCLPQRSRPDQLVALLAPAVLAQQHAGSAAEPGQREQQSRLRFTLSGAVERDRVVGGDPQQGSYARSPRIPRPRDRLPRRYVSDRLLRASLVQGGLVQGGLVQGGLVRGGVGRLAWDGAVAEDAQCPVRDLGDLLGWQHRVDDAVLEQVFGALHAGREGLAVQLLVHPGAEEADQCAGLGDRDVAQRSPGGEDTAGGRIAQVDQVRQASRLVRRDRRGDLHHLQERHGALLHPGAARPGRGEQRQLFRGGPLHGADQALGGSDADRPGQEAELAGHHHDAAAADRTGAGDHGLGHAGTLPGPGQGGGVRRGRGRLCRRRVPGLVRVRVQHQAEQLGGAQPGAGRPCRVWRYASSVRHAPILTPIRTPTPTQRAFSRPRPVIRSAGRSGRNRSPYMGTTLRRTALAGAAVIAVVAGIAAVSPAQASTGSTAAGTVFYPNPVQQLGIQTLTDQKDADYPALAPAYRRVTLTDLDGSGRLSGAYVTVKSETGKAAMTVNGDFPDWHRDADQFEQVMGYYWVTEAGHYLQHLGFGSTYPAINDPIELRINQFGGDNSFFRGDKINITLGKGGVDDAEDAEVIVHEYGHAVHNMQVPGFGTNLESGSIGEGFSDFLAVVVTSWRTGVPTLTPEACVADWDSVSYTSTEPHCLRRIDGSKHYPEDVRGEVHRDGEIWSRALYDIRNALGDALGSAIIIDAQFGFAPDTSFRAAAEQTVATAQLIGGAGAAATVHDAFAARGIL